MTKKRMENRLRKLQSLTPINALHRKYLEREIATLEQAIHRLDNPVPEKPAFMPPPPENKPAPSVDWDRLRLALLRRK